MTSPAPAAGSAPRPATLRAAAIGFPEVLMQSITQIAPALALLLTIGFNTGLAGSAAPMTYLVAFIIVLSLTVPLGELARVFPSAGGYHTYISAVLGKRTGFLAAWVYSSIAPMAPAAIGAYASYLMAGDLRTEYGIHLAWWILYLAMIAAVGLAAYRGIELSGKLMVALGVAEMTIVAALSLWGLARPGAGGVSGAGFNPASATSGHGFYLAVVFSIFGFTGWEAAIAVGEESKDPRRLIPRALTGSVLILGVFLVICAWGIQIGWGTSTLGSLAASTSPAFQLAHRFWGAGSILLLLAILNSTLADCLACTTNSTRMWFSMGRAGALPARIAAVHPKNQTPTIAIALQTAVSVVVGILGSWLVGHDQIFFVAGLVFTLGYIFVYGAGNVAVARHFLTTARPELSAWKHLVLPAFGTASLLFVGFYSLHPLPAAPVSYAPVIALVWFAAGLILMLVPGRKPAAITEAGAFAAGEPVSGKEN
jgi:amino acid transporter